MSLKKKTDVNQLEYLLISLFSISLLVLLFGYYKTMMPYRHGDTAFLIELISNVSNGASAVSHLLAQNAAEIKLAYVDLAIYCQQGLQAAQFTTDPYEVFSSLHAYLILYLIAPVAHVIGSLNAMSVFTALAFSSIPCIAYIYLRNSGVSIAVSIIASAICMIHPAWQISSNGQFYLDRLFIPFALLYTIFLHHYFNDSEKNIIKIKPQIFLVLVIMIGIIGGLTSERNMFVIGIFSLAYLLIVKTQYKKKFYIFGFSILCLLYTFSYTHFFGGTSDNARVQKNLFELPKLITAIKAPGLSEYLWFNLMLLYLPAIFTRRLCIAVLPIIAFNCFVTMGGAEKNGWLSHYHSHYYGFLIAVFLIAIASSNNTLLKGFSAITYKFITPLMISIMLAFLISLEYCYKGQGIFFGLWDYYGQPKEWSNSRTQKDMFDKLSSKVPVGATVTTTEWGMAAWYLHGNPVNIFPMGVGVNDYIMIQSEKTPENIKLLSAIRHKKGEDAVLANECFVPIILKNYEELSQAGNWVLFKKKIQTGD